MPDKIVRKWYESLEQGRRTKILNSILKCYLVVEENGKKFYGIQIPLSINYRNREGK